MRLLRRHTPAPPAQTRRPGLPHHRRRPHRVRPLAAALAALAPARPGPPARASWTSSAAPSWPTASSNPRSSSARRPPSPPCASAPTARAKAPPKSAATCNLTRVIVPAEKKWSGNSDYCIKWAEKKGRAGIGVVPPDRWETAQAISRGILGDPDCKAAPEHAGTLALVHGAWERPGHRPHHPAARNHRPGAGRRDQPGNRPRRPVCWCPIRRPAAWALRAYATGAHIRAALQRRLLNDARRPRATTTSGFSPNAMRPTWSAAARRQPSCSTLGDTILEALLNSYANCLHSGSGPRSTAPRPHPRRLHARLPRTLDDPGDEPDRQLLRHRRRPRSRLATLAPCPLRQPPAPHWVKYDPRAHSLETASVSPVAELAHRRLADSVWGTGRWPKAGAAALAALTRTTPRTVPACLARAPHARLAHPRQHPRPPRHRGRPPCRHHRSGRSPPTRPAVAAARSLEAASRHPRSTPCPRQCPRNAHAYACNAQHCASNASKSKSKTENQNQSTESYFNALNELNV